MDAALLQLEKMQIKHKHIQQLYQKDGIYLFRIRCDDAQYVLKLFVKPEYRREIQNYNMLKSLNIPTMQIVANTDCCLLMEDIEQSPSFRLGCEEDIRDAKVISEIASWYKRLHTKGKAFLAENKMELYDENDVISPENIAFIKARTHTAHSPVWAELEKNWDTLCSLIKKADKTLTYNDFHYSNLIVAKDKSSAYMFDYNLLGKGCAYADIRNVTHSFTDADRERFISEYGGYQELEKRIDDVASVLVTLYFACKRDTFPKWAKASLQEIKNGFTDKLHKLIDFAG